MLIIYLEQETWQEIKCALCFKDIIELEFKQSLHLILITIMCAFYERVCDFYFKKQSIKDKSI